MNELETRMNAGFGEEPYQFARKIRLPRKALPEVDRVLLGGQGRHDREDGGADGRQLGGDLGRAGRRKNSAHGGRGFNGFAARTVFAEHRRTGSAGLLVLPPARGLAKRHEVREDWG